MPDTNKNRLTSQSKKVALGMSGGVDSSLCAHLLVEQGYDVTGVYLECWQAPGCRTEEDRKDALKVALSLDIPFQVLDFKETYKQKVVENFFQDYEAGLTPNPDVLCNKEIKFGLFYDWAMEQGFDFVATGHYAKIVPEQKAELTTDSGPDASTSSAPPPQLVIPKDEHKDQTYFLYLIRAEQLAHTLFPLGDMKKDDVRVEAEKRQLHVADKKDSVGICFIGDINVHHFLEERLGKNPGDVIDTSGNVIGKHQGLWFYTVGQRHGFTVDKRTLISKSDGTSFEKENFPPFYVIKKLPEKNQLLVGFGAETYFKEFMVQQLHWIEPDAVERATQQTTATEGTSLGSHSAKTTEQLFVRIRHTGKLLAAQLTKTEQGFTVTLAEPTQGIAEGQSAVFYLKNKDKTICLGGGVICS